MQKKKKHGRTKLTCFSSNDVERENLILTAETVQNIKSSLKCVKSSLIAILTDKSPCFVTVALILHSLV